MNHLTKRIIAIALVIVLLTPFTPIQLKVNAANFISNPTINSITGQDLLLTLETDAVCTVYYAITPEVGPDLTASAIKTPGANSLVIHSGSQASAGTGPTSIHIDLQSLNLTNNATYRIQIMLEEGATLTLSPTKPHFKYGALSSTITLVERYKDGFMLNFTSNMNGTLYAKAFPTGTAVTDADLTSFSANSKAEVVTGIYSNTSHNVLLKSTVNMTEDTTYDIYALIVDQYNVVHKSLITTTKRTAGNKLLSVVYDNGSLADPEDDAFILTFESAVTNEGQMSDYVLELDNGSSVFQNADIVFDYHPYDYTPSIIAGNKIKLLLINTVPNYGRTRIDSAAEFDNGTVRVKVVNTSTQISPKLDSDLAECTQTAPLSQSIIFESDTPAVKLDTVTYDTANSTATRTDDKLVVNLSGSVGTDIGPADSLILEADNENTGGFKSVDVAFVRGTDYNVTNFSGTQKYIEFLDSGIAKLNTLNNAVLRVRLGNEVWENNTLARSVGSVQTILYETRTELSALKFDGTSVANFQPGTNGYTVTTRSKFYNQNNFSPLVHATPLNNRIAVTITNVSVGSVGITCTAPDGTTVNTYNLTVNEDPFSLGGVAVNGQVVNGYSPLTYQYSVALPAGTGAVPPVDLKFDHGDITNASLTITSSGSLPGTLIYNVLVTAFATTKNIEITFTSQANANHGPDPEPSAPTPTSPVVVTTPTIPQTEVAGIEQVANASANLGQASTSPNENPTEPIVSALDRLTIIVQITENNLGLTGVLQRLPGSLELIAKDMSTPKVDDAKVLKEVTEMTKAVESQLDTVTNPESALKLISDYIQAVKLIKEAGNNLTPALDQSVEDMLFSVSQRLGTLKLETPKTEVKGIVLQPEDIGKTIERQLGFIDQIQTLNNQFFNDSQSRDFSSEVTIQLELPKTTENFDVTFKAASLDNLSKNKIDRFSLDINGSKITIPTANADLKTDFKVILNFEDTQSGQTGLFSQQPLPANQPIVDFTVYENNKLVEFFQKPIRLTFQLKQFSVQGEDPNTLAILRFDEALKAWTPVGGMVDPELGIIFVDRSTLSQYTVMKSKKTLSQADQSWAKAEINAMLNKGIIAETSSFAPTSLVTRAEFAAWIAKAYGLKDSGKALGFKDVSKSNEHYAAIQAVCQQGIMGGKSKTQFDPNGNLTTEEMAVMIGKVLVLFDDKKSSEKVKSKYLAELKTNQVASWATGDTALLMELGLSKSTSLADGKALVTKEVAAAVLMGAYQS